MKIVNTFALTLFAGLFLMACNQQPQQVATTEPYPNNAQVANIAPEEWDYWAKDNFDLQRVGPILERSRNAQEFESYLNTRDGINNLDLDGDGYVDYLSVDEYPNCNEYECGMSIYDRFGPDRAQEVATVVFYRDEPRYRGSRILITGNDNLYGDNYYYETNWLDRTLNLVSYLFAPHTTYRSPYYYDYYPPGYTVYDVVDTPVYVNRIEQLYPQPVFVYTTAPTILEKVKIKSPNNGLHLGQIKARLVKPTKEQAEFRKNNPGKPERVKNNQGGEKQGKQEPPGQAKKGEDHGGNPNKEDNPNRGGNPNKQDNPNKGGNPDKGGGNPYKGGNPNKGGNPDRGGGNPNNGGGKGKKG